MSSVDVPKPRHSKGITYTGLVSGAVALIFGAYWYAVHADVAPLPVPGEVPVPVTTELAVSGPIPVYLDGLGTVQAYNSVTLKTRVDGQLQQVLFNEGQDVKKGDLLAVIDPRGFQAALEQATAKLKQDDASLTNAQYLLDKDQKLATQNITTAEEVETQKSVVAGLEAQVAQDQASKDAAAVSLSYTQLHAPIDGRTGFRLVDEGNQVHATDTSGIVVITQLRPITVVSTLADTDLPAVQAALRAGKVAVSAMTRDGTVELAKGYLSVVDNEIDQSTGTVRLKSTFDNADDALWPGQFVNLRLLQKMLPNAVTIPSPALQRGPDGFFLFVVGTDNRVAQVPVTPGQIAAGRAVITSGLSSGQKVVTFGQYRLEPGVLVEETPADLQAAGVTKRG